MRTLIKNAIVVQSGESRQASVLIEDHLISAVGDLDDITADRTIDADGLHLIPGVVDSHVHFREPGVTHKEDLHTATRACVKGGVTSFLEMPNTKPQTTTCEALEEKLDIASRKSHVNYGFYIGATTTNLEELQKAQRTPGIKIFIGSSTGNMLVDDQDVLENIFGKTTLPICAHCEDETIVRANTQRINGGSIHSDHSVVRDHEAAIVSTKRAIDLSLRHQHRFHLLHVSTQAESELLTPKVRQFVTAEVCPHHLFFNVEDYARLGSKVQMNPSVKDPSDNAGLFNALLNGVIDIVVTDHAPHTLEEKDQPYPASPSGLPAVENALALMLNEVNMGKCTLSQVVQWMCTGPATIWHMKNKGRILPGFDADLALIDMTADHTILDENQLTKCGWSPWHGTKLKGKVVHTLVNGQTVFENDQINDEILGKEIEYVR